MRIYERQPIVYSYSPFLYNSYYLSQETITDLSNWCIKNCKGWWMVDYKGMQFKDKNDYILARFVYG